MSECEVQIRSSGVNDRLQEAYRAIEKLPDSAEKLPALYIVHAAMLLKQLDFRSSTEINSAGRNAVTIAIARTQVSDAYVRAVNLIDQDGRLASTDQIRRAAGQVFSGLDRLMNSYLDVKRKEFESRNRTVDAEVASMVARTKVESLPFNHHLAAPRTESTIYAEHRKRIENMAIVLAKYNLSIVGDAYPETVQIWLDTMIYSLAALEMLNANK